MGDVGGQVGRSDCVTGRGKEETRWGSASLAFSLCGRGEWYVCQVSLLTFAGDQMSQIIARL